MNIETNRRYFKLKPHAAEIFNKYARDLNKAAQQRLQIAKAFLIEQGVPEDQADAKMYQGGNAVVFPSELRKYIPKVLKSPDRNGFCHVKANLKVSKQLERDLEQVTMPHVRDYLPTLNIGHMTFMGGYMLQVVIGHYGGHVVLNGVPKEYPDGWSNTPYEPDLDLLEELTLAQWAELVEEVESKDK